MEGLAHYRVEEHSPPTELASTDALTQCIPSTDTSLVATSSTFNEKDNYNERYGIVYSHDETFDNDELAEPRGELINPWKDDEEDSYYLTWDPTKALVLHVSKPQLQDQDDSRERTGDIPTHPFNYSTRDQNDGRPKSRVGFRDEDPEVESDEESEYDDEDYVQIIGTDNLPQQQVVESDPYNDVDTTAAVTDHNTRQVAWSAQYDDGQLDIAGTGNLPHQLDWLRTPSPFAAEYGSLPLQRYRAFILADQEAADALVFNERWLRAVEKGEMTSPAKNVPKDVMARLVTSGFVRRLSTVERARTAPPSKPHRSNGSRQDQTLEQEPNADQGEFSSHDEAVEQESSVAKDESSGRSGLVEQASEVHQGDSSGHDKDSGRRVEFNDGEATDQDGDLSEESNAVEQSSAIVVAEAEHDPSFAQPGPLTAQIQNLTWYPWETATSPEVCQWAQQISDDEDSNGLYGEGKTGDSRWKSLIIFSATRHLYAVDESVPLPYGANGVLQPPLAYRRGSKGHKTKWDAISESKDDAYIPLGMETKPWFDQISAKAELIYCPRPSKLNIVQNSSDDSCEVFESPATKVAKPQGWKPPSERAESEVAVATTEKQKSPENVKTNAFDSTDEDSTRIKGMASQADVSSTTHHEEIAPSSIQTSTDEYWSPMSKSVWDLELDELMEDAALTNASLGRQSESCDVDHHDSFEADEMVESSSSASELSSVEADPLIIEDQVNVEADPVTGLRHDTEIEDRVNGQSDTSVVYNEKAGMLVENMKDYVNKPDTPPRTAIWQATLAVRSRPITDVEIPKPIPEPQSPINLEFVSLRKPRKLAVGKEFAIKLAMEVDESFTDDEIIEPDRDWRSADGSVLRPRFTVASEIETNLNDVSQLLEHQHMAVMEDSKDLGAAMTSKKAEVSPSDSGYSSVRLSRATSGQSLPELQVVERAGSEEGAKHMDFDNFTAGLGSDKNLDFKTLEDSTSWDICGPSISTDSKSSPENFTNPGSVCAPEQVSERLTPFEHAHESDRESNDSGYHTRNGSREVDVKELAQMADNAAPDPTSPQDSESLNAANQKIASLTKEVEELRRYAADVTHALAIKTALPDTTDRTPTDNSISAPTTTVQLVKPTATGFNASGSPNKATVTPAMAQRLKQFERVMTVHNTANMTPPTERLRTKLNAWRIKGLHLLAVGAGGLIYHL